MSPSMTELGFVFKPIQCQSYCSLRSRAVQISVLHFHLSLSAAATPHPARPEKKGLVENVEIIERCGRQDPCVLVWTCSWILARPVSSLLWVLLFPAFTVGGGGRAATSVCFSVTVVLWVWAVKEEMLVPFSTGRAGESCGAQAQFEDCTTVTTDVQLCSCEGKGVHVFLILDLHCFTVSSEIILWLSVS